MQSGYYFKDIQGAFVSKVLWLTVSCVGPLSCHERGPLPWTSDAANPQELQIALLQH